MTDTGRPDDEGTDDKLSLKMPSFSLRRRTRTPDEGPTPAGDPEPPVAPATATHEPFEPVEPSEPAEPARREPRRRLPEISLSGVRAAAATGVVVGLLAVLLSWLATSTCDVVRGTSSCGGGAGLLILVAELVLLAYAGSLLLRFFHAPDAGSTSVLAVGILAVLVLVFLLGSVDEWWMVIAVPVAAVIAYCTSWWVTDAVVGADDGPEADASQRRDVR